MLTSKTQVIIAGVLVHLLCYYGLFKYLQPMECGWLFYIVAAFFELAFVMWVGINEYMSESEIEKLNESSASGYDNKDIKYKSDGDYRLAAILSIAVSVIPVASLMVAMHFNQSGTCEIKWYHFIGICILGMIVMYSVPILQGCVGSMKWASEGKPLEKKKETSETGPLDLSFIMHLENDYSPRISPKIMEGISNLEKMMDRNRILNCKQSWVTVDEYKRAEEAVTEALHKVTGGRLKGKVLLPSHTLVSDLGLTGSLMEELDVECFSSILVEEYILFCSWMSDESYDGEIHIKTNKHFNNTMRIMYWNMISKGLKVGVKPLPKPEKVESILPTLKDWYECAADVLHYANIVKSA